VDVKNVSIRFYGSHGSDIFQKGGFKMLQFIMDRNLLLYLLAAACVVGVASQMILKQIYEKLIRDTKNTGEPDGRIKKK